MSVTFPTWVVVLLVVLAAAIAYTMAQTTVTFDNTVQFALGLAQVVIATLLGFQRSVTNTVRNIRRP